MSQSDFGLYTYIFFFITSVSNVLTFGFGTSKVKLFFDYEEKRGELLYSINTFIAVVFAVLVLICALTNIDVRIMGSLVTSKNFNYSNIRLYLLGYIYFLMIFNLLNVYYSVAQKILIFQKYNLLRIILMNGIIIGLLHFYTTETYVTRIGFEATLSFIVFAPLVIKYVKKFSFKLNTKILRHALSIGLPIMATSVATLFYTMSDKYFLQKYIGIDLLAVYNLAFYLTLPLGLILSTFNLLWVPIFFKEKNIQVNSEKTSKVLKIMLLSLVVIALLIWLLAFLVVSMGYISNSYSFVIILFPLIAISSILDCISQLYNNFVVLFEKTAFTLILTLVLSVLVYALNHYLVPLYGVYSTVGILIFLSAIRFSALFLFAKINIQKNIFSQNSLIL